MRPIAGPTLLVLLIAPILASHAQETFPSADCAFFESLLDRSAVSVPWNRGSCCNYSVDVTLTDGGVRKTTRGFTCRSGRVVTASVVNLGLNGTLPSLENFTSLEIIELNNNNFTGAFPSVTGLKNLTRIYAGSNFFTTIPDVSGNPVLEYLVIPRNEITGTIPNLTSFTKLFSVGFYDNKLEGSIDGLLPQTLSFCSLTNFNTNPKLFTVSGDFPKVCLAEDQIIPFPNGTAFGRADGGNRSTGGPNVTLIGACAGGGVLVLIAGVVGFAYYRKKRRRMNEEKGKSPDEPHWFFLRIAGPQGLEDAPNIEYSGAPFLVEQKYEASAPDELSLTPGSMVDVRTIYRDGWASCFDPESGAVGTAPLDCLHLADHLLPAQSSSFPLQPGESLVRITSGSFFGAPQSRTFSNHEHSSAHSSSLQSSGPLPLRRKPTEEQTLTSLESHSTGSVRKTSSSPGSSLGNYHQMRSLSMASASDPGNSQYVRLPPSSHGSRDRTLSGKGSLRSVAEPIELDARVTATHRHLASPTELLGRE